MTSPGGEGGVFSSRLVWACVGHTQISERHTWISKRHSQISERHSRAARGMLSSRSNRDFRGEEQPIGLLNHVLLNHAYVCQSCLGTTSLGEEGSVFPSRLLWACVGHTRISERHTWISKRQPYQ